MVFALDCHVNSNSSSSRNNNNNNSNNGYVFVLVNSPKNVLKTRFLFLLNKLSLTSKENKIEREKRRRKNKHLNSLHSVSTFGICSFFQEFKSIYRARRRKTLTKMDRLEERERDRERMQTKMVFVVVFCSKLVLRFIHPTYQSTIHNSTMCQLFIVVYFHSITLFICFVYIMFHLVLCDLYIYDAFCKR